MIKRILPAVLICLLLLAGGCGEDNQAGPSGEDTIAVEVVNSTDNIIVSFAIFFGTELEEWGMEMLEEEIIEPGASFTFLLPHGTYDLSLWTYEQYVILTEWGIDDDTVIELGGDDLVTVFVQNDSEQDIYSVFFSPEDSDVWGDDYLGDMGFIPAQIGRRFFFLEPGIYDMLVIGEEGDRLVEAFQIDITDTRAFTID